MNSRLLFLGKKFVNIYQSRRHASHKTFCDAHMNELPIPCGPFEPYYKECQAFYNKVLTAGAIWWAFSFIMMIYTNSFYLNFSPPAQPGPPTEMIQDADDRC